MGIHFLHCAYNNGYITTNDAVCDVFVVIAQDARLHIKQKQLHVYFFQPSLIPFVDKLTLCSPKITFAT